MRTLCILLLVACEPGQLTSVGELNRGGTDSSVPPTDGGPGVDTGMPDPDGGGATDAGLTDVTLPPPDADKPGDMCGDTRTSTRAFRGTFEPSITPMTAEQVLAIGSISGCSATLITPTWVLTATHCNPRVGGNFCMGSEPSRPDRCVRIARVEQAPGYNARVQFDNDLTLLELAQDAREVAPGVVPIPIYTDELVSADWVGRDVEMAGYGRTETGSSGTRFFAPMRVSQINASFIRMEGMGRGTCYGDSGGPVLFVADDGTLRVAGDASHILGSPPTCGETAQYTRTDILRDWIEGFTGPTVIEGAPCGDVTAEGQCNGDRAVYCAGEELQVDQCDTCGWDAASNGFRCITGADPCEGLDRVGECSGTTARWCERGVVKERDCGACDQTCGREAGLYYCVDDPCMGLDYLGQCSGNVAEWCEDGELRTVDCGAMGQSCGWINDTYGYYCR